MPRRQKDKGDIHDRSRNNTILHFIGPDAGKPDGSLSVSKKSRSKNP
jgi:hypothetical protein